MEQVVLFLEPCSCSRSRPTVELVTHRERPAVAVSIPADGGTRHSPGGSSGRGLEPGRSVREPDIPVLEGISRLPRAFRIGQYDRQFNRRRGTGLVRVDRRR